MLKLQEKLNDLEHKTSKTVSEIKRENQVLKNQVDAKTVQIKTLESDYADSLEKLAKFEDELNTGGDKITEWITMVEGYKTSVER